MSSRQLTFAESKNLKKYMAMSTEELIRELNFSLIPKSSAESFNELLRGRFWVLSDIKTIFKPLIITSRINLFLSETRQILLSDPTFIHSLEKLLALEPTDEELITFVYDFLETHGDRRRSQMRIATYICRVGIEAFLS